MLTDENGEQVDSENEIISPEFHGTNDLRQREKKDEDEKCCTASAS